LAVLFGAWGGLLAGPPEAQEPNDLSGLLKPQPAPSVASGDDLLKAAAEGQTALVRRLLDEGAPLDALDANRRTPLHLAASRGHADVVGLLLAKITGKAKPGQTSIIELPSSPPSKFQAPSPGAMDPPETDPRQPGPTPSLFDGPAGSPRSGGLSFDEYLAGMSFDAYLKRAKLIDAQDNLGLTPLHLASYNGHDKAAALLIDAGADLQPKGQFDLTPLHLAAGRGHRAVVELLLGRGAPAGARNSQGATADQTAADPQIAELIRRAIAQAQEIVPPGPMPVDPDRVDPGGMEPPPAPIGQEQYPLSPQQRKLVDEFGYPPAFALTFIRQEIAGETIDARMETWQYYDCRTTFSFFNGRCTSAKELEQIPSGRAMLVCKPTEFRGGMSIDEVRRKLQDPEFRPVTARELGLDAQLLQNTSLWMGGGLMLSFVGDELVCVQCLPRFAVTPPPYVERSAP
jgi:hypothetical protein